MTKDSSRVRIARSTLRLAALHRQPTFAPCGASAKTESFDMAASRTLINCAPISWRIAFLKEWTRQTSKTTMGFCNSVEPLWPKNSRLLQSVMASIPNLNDSSIGISRCVRTTFAQRPFSTHRHGAMMLPNSLYGLNDALGVRRSHRWIGDALMALGICRSPRWLVYVRRSWKAGA